MRRKNIITALILIGLFIHDVSAKAKKSIKKDKTHCGETEQLYVEKYEQMNFQRNKISQAMCLAFKQFNIASDKVQRGDPESDFIKKVTKIMYGYKEDVEGYAKELRSINANLTDYRIEISKQYDGETPACLQVQLMQIDYKYNFKCDEY